MLEQVLGQLTGACLQNEALEALFPEELVSSGGETEERREGGRTWRQRGSAMLASKAA